MTRIRLVVTGDVEEVALGKALNELFPQARFSTVKKNAGNSYRLSKPTLPARSEFLAFVNEIVASGHVEQIPGGQPFDYVLIVDDLELNNADQPEMAIEHLKFAIEARLSQLPNEAVIPKGKNKDWPYLYNDAGRRAYLRERCSYHLLSPMVESLFFGDVHKDPDKPIAHWNALRRANAIRDPIFEPAGIDIEKFVTTDQDFLTSPVKAGWTNGAAAEPTWRAKHPKHYLSFLCDPDGTKPLPYKEKSGGKAALETLQWRNVLATPDHTLFLRAMLVDVAHMLGVEVPWLDDGVQHPLTCRRRNGILRNIA